MRVRRNRGKAQGTEGSRPLASVLRSGRHPVTAGHTLLIPRRHLASGGDLFQPELNALWRLQSQQRAALMAEDPSIQGFNFGLNDGEAAGQTVGHCHFHLIPRRSGDMDDPLGGVRGVIPERQKY